MGTQLRGGESEALNRLRTFIRNFTQSNSSGDSTTATTSHGSSRQVAAPPPDFCCKISPWLALGCLSPRQLYVQLQQEAGTAVAGQSGQQLQGVQGAGADDNPGV